MNNAKFVDENGGDLHLRSNSPAVGAGDPASFPSRDIDGQGRPAHGPPDAGADEWDAAAGGTPGGGKPKTKRRLVTGMHVNHTRRGGHILHMRLRRPARVSARIDRRAHKRYRVVRHLRVRRLKAGQASIRLGRLHMGRYRLRVVATERSGAKSRPKLRFRVHRRTRLSA